MGFDPTEIPKQSDSESVVASRQQSTVRLRLISSWVPSLQDTINTRCVRARVSSAEVTQPPGMGGAGKSSPSPQPSGKGGKSCKMPPQGVGWEICGAGLPESSGAV
eukprot:COSAG01_NODE_994_length_12252_cov_10.271044_10_plen_106_part_00